MYYEGAVGYVVSSLLNPRTWNIHVTPELIKFAEHLDRSKKTSKKRLVLASDYELNGVIGQYAVCQALGIEMDTEIYYGGDGGTDIKWKNLTIQVKSTPYSISKDGGMPHLIFFNDEKYVADVYILMITKNPQVTFAGWVTREEVVARYFAKSGFPPDYNGNTTRRVIPIKALNDSIYNEIFQLKVDQI